jgi:NTP pyrophosphatase (non-canonical NTP hydrolase)
MDLSLNECKRKTMEICRKKGWDKVPVENIWMFLTEEIGELASAIRRSTNQFSDRKKTSIEGEIMDVLSYLLQIAHIFDIDLDSAMRKHLSVKT